MKKRFKDLFLKALWFGIRSVFCLFLVLIVANYTLDVYSYAKEQFSYSIVLFIIIGILILLSCVVLIFTKVVMWKVLTILILCIIYFLMNFYDNDVIYSNQVRVCIEGNYNDCVLKDQFEEP